MPQTGAKNARRLNLLGASAGILRFKLVRSTNRWHEFGAPAGCVASLLE